VARALISKAASGDVAALKELGDRIDGKVPQLIGGDRENPMQYQRIERVIVQVEDKRAHTIEHASADVQSDDSGG
jgi:hypothetical protein